MARRDTAQYITHSSVTCFENEKHITKDNVSNEVNRFSISAYFLEVIEKKGEIELIFLCKSWANCISCWYL